MSVLNKKDRPHTIRINLAWNQAIVGFFEPTSPLSIETESLAITMDCMKRHSKHLPILAALSVSACAIFPAAMAQEPAATTAAPAAAPASAEAPVTWQSLAVYPPAIRISAQNDTQHFIAVATRTDGITVDVSDQVQWRLENPAVARIDNLVIHPVVDGATALIGSWNGLEAKATLEITQSQTPRTVGFERDVMPILTKSGCNTGSCHGAARGKDGFRMSLFGFDPLGDYLRITREIGIRRINLAVPDQSLLLLKATGAVQHSGGKKIEPGSKHYNTILSWLQSGAPADAARPPTVTKVDLYPNQAVLEGEGAQQRLVAVATYADGTQRDVWDLAGFTTNNERTAAVSLDGRITGGVRGEAFVMARFDTHTVGTQVLGLPSGLQFQPKPSAGNYIDALVDAKLLKLRLTASGPCTDEEFVRRVTVDITGLLPTEEETAAFLANTEPNKRAQLIDSLLSRKEFSEIWAMKWADLLMIKSKNEVSYKAAYLYYNWLINQIASNTPIDKIVRDLLTANGGTFENPATNFYQVEQDRLKMSENVAQVFMGIRTQCAQCHNHPFDRWTMDDYYGFTAFFSQVGRKQSEDYRQILVFNSFGGEVNHPVGGAVVKPKFLGGPVPETAGKDRRALLAQWITSNENPYFAKSIANRIWDHFTGVGIVNPVDDFRASNPPSNPELLDTLGVKLIEYKYDIKQLVRDICNSAAYQRSATPLPDNEQDLRNYSHATVRRIPAENLMDCISQITSTKEKFRGLPLGARAVQIADGATSNYFLTTFGRSPRTTVCADEATTDPSLSQALHLINGGTVSGKINQGQQLAQWKQQGLTSEMIIDKIYLRCLSRKPTDPEKARLIQLINESANPDQGLHDVFWAILNSREFIFNH
jgi:hypothetical protein